MFACVRWSGCYGVCVCVALAGCYGVPEEDGVDDNRSDLSSFTTVPWFCDVCKAGAKSLACVRVVDLVASPTPLPPLPSCLTPPPSPLPQPCELCPTTGGLMKQSIDGR